jgi:hypothetical protein
MSAYLVPCTDAANPHVEAAVCAAYGYQETADGQPNPQTRWQFVIPHLQNHLRQITRAYEKQEAREVAEKTVTDAF